MIEGITILAVFLAAAGFFIVTRLHAQEARRNPVAERTRLEESLVWHTERLRRAKEKQWDPEMIRSIAHQLAEVQAQLADVPGGRPPPDKKAGLG